MKTLFNNVLKSGLAAIILTASLFSFNASAATIAVDHGNSGIDIKKVIVKGNTKVLLVQGTRETVNIDEADLEKVTLKQIGHTLTINSSENSPVTVVVYVKDIYRIDASGNTNVKTIGKFNVKNLQVMLKDDAKARVKANTGSIYTVVAGNAKLELIGATGTHVSKLTGAATIDTNKFAASKTNDANTLAMVTDSLSNQQTATINR